MAVKHNAIDKMADMMSAHDLQDFRDQQDIGYNGVFLSYHLYPENRIKSGFRYFDIHPKYLPLQPI